MPKCLLPFCVNDPQDKLPGVYFFRMNEKRYNSWMKAIGRDPASEVLSYNNLICSDHFLPEDIDATGRRVKLSTSAVPCFKLKRQTQIMEQPSHQQELFRFPSNLKRGELWLEFVKKTGKDVSKYAELCSQHFEERDFDRSPFRVKLLSTAIRTRNIFRHKRTKASQSQIVPLELDTGGVPLEPAPSTPSAQHTDVSPRFLSASNLDLHYLDPVPSTSTPQSMETSPGNKQNIPQLEEDTPRKKKLKQQVRTLAAINQKKRLQVRHLQKRVFAQKKQIFHLRTVVKELEKKNLVSAYHFYRTEAEKTI